ncbi:MAG: tetratricopeptide repeat protein [Kiritimatiellae bacterium]|nr:tetratricopeptide repeat protein [Kiritimatiellia bacterium]
MSFSRSSALSRALAAAALAALAGCGAGDGSAEYSAGERAFESRDYKTAEAGFSKCAALAPDNVDALLMLVRTELALGNIVAAREASARAEELAGDEPDVMELAAQAAFHAQDYAKAKSLYERLSGDPKLDAGVRSRAWSGLGVVEMAGMSAASIGESRDRALTAFLRAVRLDGRNAAARYHLGRLYRDTFGYSEMAVDQFSLYSHLAPASDQRVQTVVRKTIPALREHVSRAAAQRRGADRRNSAASAAALKKAEDAWKKGTFKTAKLRYAEAYEADVLSYPAALGLARSWEKTDSSRAGLAEALKYYKDATSLRPSDRATLMKVGELATKLGSGASAVEAYSRAVAAAPNDISAIDALIRALGRAGNRGSAAVYQRYRDFVASQKR